MAGPQHVSPTLAAALKEMGDQIVRMQRRIYQLERNQRQAQLGNSSIENGTLTIKDGSGTPVIQVGLQGDGTFALQHVNAAQGPPPQPNQPTVLAGINTLLVTWDGTMHDGTDPLADFAAVNVYCVDSSTGEPPTQTPLQGSMAGPGTFMVGNLVGGDEYFVWLTTVNAAGLESDPSDQVPAIPLTVGGSIGPNAIVAGMVNFSASDIGGITVTISPFPPTDPGTGALWYDATNGYLLNQWNGSSWQPYAFGHNAISAGSITADLIAAATITSAQIAAGTILASNIAAGTITATQIAANTITATELAAGIIYAGIVDGTTIQGASIVADGTSGEVLVYSGAPASGALIVAVSGAAGTDAFGNTYIAGAQFGVPGGSGLNIIPDSDVPVSVSTVVSGIMGGIAELTTTDVDQTLGGVLGSAILGSGTSAKMSTILTSPFGTQGAGILLAAQNDGATDVAWTLLCAVSTPDDETLVLTPIAAFLPYAMLLYSGSSGTTVVTKTSGSGTIPIPVGVTTGYGEAWGAGGSQAGVSGGTGNPLAGCGSGEYAAEPNLALTSGGTASYSVGATGRPGGGSTLTGSAATVTAHGGQATTTTTPGNGGTGSTNTIHFDGARGGNAGGSNQGGGGGGGAAGPGGAGNHGNAGGPGSNGGGAGGSGAAGGGQGGDGGNPGQNASTGFSPGGGGGGGGSTADGADGGHGKVRLTYSTGAPQIMCAIASAAGTDPFGTSFPAGSFFPGNGDGNQYSVGPRSLIGPTAAAQNITSTSFTQITNMSCAVQPGTYRVHAVVLYQGNQAAGAPAFEFTGPTVSNMSVAVKFQDMNGTNLVSGGRLTTMGGSTIGPTLLSGPNQLVEFDGVIVFSAAGTLALKAAENTSGDSFQILIYSFMDVWPV